MTIDNLRTALIKLIRNNKGKILSLEDMYIQFHNYYDLSEYQLENDLKYPRPRYKHEIRSILAKLVKEGIVTRLGMNQYEASAE